MAVEFSVSRLPILWSSFNTWLKPPYLFVTVNFIITIIAASSKLIQSLDDDEEDTQIQAMVQRAAPVQIDVKEAGFEFSVPFTPPIVVAEVVCEEKEEEINGGDQVTENLPSSEIKPLVSVRSGNPKLVKSSAKGKRKKALRVVKPKRQETTMENTWRKMVPEEGKSTTLLTGRYKRSDSFGLDDVGGVKVKPALRKSVTFRDITNYHHHEYFVEIVKEEMLSPSVDELNRRVEAFIKKSKEERRLESLRLNKQAAA